MFWHGIRKAYINTNRAGLRLPGQTMRYDEINGANEHSLLSAIDEGFTHIAFRLTDGAEYSYVFTSERDMAAFCVDVNNRPGLLTDDEWQRYQANGWEWREMQNWHTNTLQDEFNQLMESLQK